MVLVTVAISEEVQPLLVFVTVRVYVPAAFTTGERVVAPETIPPLGPVHKYVKVGPEEDPAPFKATVGWAQVITAGGPASAVGGVVLLTTVTVAVFVHPLASVTVTV